jgi:hypothetical protein
MNVYVVDRSLPGITDQALAEAQQAAIRTARQLTDAGKPVEYIRSSFLPESAECRCLFRADDIASVRELNDKAGLPYERIVPALDLSP